MRYLHTMVRITDVDKSLDFYCNKLGMTEVRRRESPEGRFTLIFLASSDDAAAGAKSNAPLLELTYINRPPRDGRMAFIRSPDNISIEILQKGEAKAPAEPWKSAPNIGQW
jgi:lactoylglutathione lyase